MIRRMSYWVVFAVVLCLSWFLLFKRVVIIHVCPACGYGDLVTEYRLGPYVLHRSTIEHHTTVEWIAGTLGVACMHEKSQLSVASVHAGFSLLVKSRPGTYFIGGSDQVYSASISQTVERLKLDDPGLATQFKERVLVSGDLQYLHKFWTNLMVIVERGRRTTPDSSIDNEEKAEANP